MTNLPPPTTTRNARVVIIGGGIAGLSAAWWLSKKGFNDYILLELEREVGGTAQSGANAISPFPWGAHYVPVPGEDATYVRAFFEEIGAITGYNADGDPVYDELMVCGAPESRLFIHGRWQEGIVPNTALSLADQDEYRRFFEALERFRFAVGRDGRRAFTIPARLSSSDPEFRRYDTMTFAALARSWGITSPSLLWYIDYCFRDDYGAPSDRISAWAGLHYFCARLNAQNSSEEQILTWPNGNGFLVHELRRRTHGTVETEALATAVIPSDTGVRIEYLRTGTGEREAIDAEVVIYAAPRFTAPYVVRTSRTEPPQAYHPTLEYAPWAVANISLASPRHGGSRRFAWDNVFYRGKTIGYVVATHQSLALGTGATVLTMYWPLSESDPKSARTAALSRSADEWSHLFLEELLRFHPEFAPDVERVDLWIWGHGMAIPTPGLFDRWEQDRSPHPRIVFANADRTGFGLFEEAQYWGVEAAREFLGRTESV